MLSYCTCSPRHLRVLQSIKVGDTYTNLPSTFPCHHSLAQAWLIFVLQPLPHSNRSNKQGSRFPYGPPTIDRFNLAHFYLKQLAVAALPPIINPYNMSTETPSPYNFLLTIHVIKHPTTSFILRYHFNKMGQNTFHSLLVTTLGALLCQQSYEVCPHWASLAYILNSTQKPITEAVILKVLRNSLTALRHLLQFKQISLKWKQSTVKIETIPQWQFLCWQFWYWFVCITHTCICVYDYQPPRLSTS